MLRNLPKFLMISAVAILTGCGSEGGFEPPLLVATEDPRLEQSLAEAANFWNEGFPFRVVEAGEGQATLVVVDYHPCDEDGCATLFPDGTCLIQIHEDCVNEWWLVAHELGHCMGLGHSEDAGSIMFKDTNPNQKITPEIVEALQ